MKARSLSAIWLPPSGFTRRPRRYPARAGSPWRSVRAARRAEPGPPCWLGPTSQMDRSRPLLTVGRQRQPEHQGAAPEDGRFPTVLYYGPSWPHTLREHGRPAAFMLAAHAAHPATPAGPTYAALYETCAALIVAVMLVIYFDERVRRRMTLRVRGYAVGWLGGIIGTGLLVPLFALAGFIPQTGRLDLRDGAVGSRVPTLRPRSPGERWRYRSDAWTRCKPTESDRGRSGRLLAADGRTTSWCFPPLSALPRTPRTCGAASARSSNLPGSILA
jgi:hypothetical protein